MTQRDRRFLASLFFSVAFFSVASSQEASPYVPLSHWSVPFIEHLIAAGRLADPTPLTRPFRTDQVLRALDAVDSTTVTSAEWAVVRQVRSDLTRPERGPTPRLAGHGGIPASSHPRPEPALPRPRWGARAGGWGEWPPGGTTHPTRRARQCIATWGSTGSGFGRPVAGRSPCGRARCSRVSVGSSSRGT